MVWREFVPPAREAGFDRIAWTQTFTPRLSEKAKHCSKNAQTKRERKKFRFLLIPKNMTRNNTPSQGWYIIFHRREELRRPCISQDKKQAVPWDPSGGCTSGACTLSPHRFASWTGWCPALSSCSFHQWCDQTAPHPPHCRGKRWNFESWLHEHRVCILREVAAQVPVALTTGMCLRSYFLAFFTIWVTWYLCGYLQYTLCLYLQHHTTKVSKSLLSVDTL